MPRVTALRPDRGGEHVVVELDGSPWRRLPTEVAVRVGLATDTELGRTDLRTLGRELRRVNALDVAARSLRHRDRSRADLRRRLEERGIAPAAREEALETLTRAGIVDDERLARTRSAALAARGCGDERILADLLEAGLDRDLAAEAIAELEDEHERAVRIVATRGEGVATARWLARRGFSRDSVDAALPRLVADGG